jgi:16S rRNA (cytosine967-C5)-methyltransferase
LGKVNDVLIDKRELRSRRHSWDIVKRATLKNRRLTDVLAERIRHGNFTDQEKRFITEIVQGSVRMAGRLDWELSQVFKGNMDDLKSHYLILLRIGVYQIRYMDSIPDYAAVTTTVQLAKQIHENLGGLTNALLRSLLKCEMPEAPDEHTPINYTAQYYSHPEWLINKWFTEGSFKDAIALANWNNKAPQLWFRVNTIKYTSTKFKKYLKEKEIEFEQFPHLKNFFAPKTSVGLLLNSDLFKEGNLSIQDPAGGLVVSLLDPQKGETIVDGCSAPGGKTGFVAELMKNKGKIFAYDKSQERLGRLSTGMERLSIDIVDAEIKDLTQDRLPTSNKIILDVPCSGTGVMAKRADLRWRRDMDNLLEFHLQQRKILWESSNSIQPGGIIVYSTCSLEFEENWMVVEAFLKSHPDFTLDSAENYVPKEFVDDKGALFTFPPKHGIDGGFAVRLVKNA